MMIFLMTWANISYAQTDVHIKDTLTEKEKRQFIAATRNTSFGYFRLADSFSRKGDIVGAGIALSMINPYFFMFMGQTPDSILQYLSGRFKLVKETREAYAERFTETFKADRTETYANFKAMYEEDKAVRRLLNSCGDSFSCEIAKKRLLRSDSIHSEYLYTYVQKKGWPELSDGSLYAGTLAINDHSHHKDYVPALKAGVMKGDAPFEILELVCLWTHYIYTYKELHDVLSTHTYRRFDISSVINHQLPGSLPRIEKAVRQLCPPKLYFVAECRDKKLYDVFLAKDMKEWMGSGGGILAELVRDLSFATCKSAKSYKAISYGLSNMRYFPTESNELRVTLYIVKNEE